MTLHDQLQAALDALSEIAKRQERPPVGDLIARGAVGLDEVTKQAAFDYGTDFGEWSAAKIARRALKKIGRQR